MGLSTGLAIFDILKELHKNWNDTNFTGCIFIDFSRAFDTIISTALIPPPGRKHNTSICGCQSLNASVTYGTAQGSILGPPSFILYVNDIFTSVNPDSSTYMYPDDTLVLCKTQSVDEVTSKAKAALGRIIKLV